MRDLHKFLNNATFFFTA